jgi:hypothetical protein
VVFRIVSNDTFVLPKTAENPRRNRRTADAPAVQWMISVSISRA